jgi:hypothetical protein
VLAAAWCGETLAAIAVLHIYKSVANDKRQRLTKSIGRKTPMRMKRLLIPLFLIPSLAAADEIGLFVSQGWSNNAEVQNPFGFGAYFSKNVTGSFAVGISFERFTTQRAYDGYTSEGLGFNPVWEPIRGSIRTSIWKLRLSYFPIQYEHIAFGVGSAVSTTSIDISKNGTQTGRPVAEQGGQKFGVGFSLLIQATPIKSLPLIINVDAHRHFFGESTSIATESGTPVYGAIAITSVSLAIGYLFSLQ